MTCNIEQIAGRPFVPESQFQKDLTDTYKTFIKIIEDVHTSITESIGSVKLIIDMQDNIQAYKLVDMVRDLGIKPSYGEYQDSHYLTCDLGEGKTLVIDTACPARFYGQGKHENNILKNIENILERLNESSKK